MSEFERRPGVRSDAQRNRQRIIDAATHALTTGPNPVKIETIADCTGEKTTSSARRRWATSS